MDKNWNDLLVEHILSFENCRDETEYALAVAKFVAHANDSHVHVSANALDALFWQSSAPF